SFADLLRWWHGQSEPARRRPSADGGDWRWRGEWQPSSPERREYTSGQSVARHRESLWQPHAELRREQRERRAVMKGALLGLCLALAASVVAAAATPPLIEAVKS